MTGLSSGAKSVLKEMNYRKGLSPRQRKLYDQGVKMAQKAVKKGQGEEFLKALREV